jgi:hypothetical protein
VLRASRRHSVYVPASCLVSGGSPPRFASDARPVPPDPFRQLNKQLWRGEC